MEVFHRVEDEVYLHHDVEAGDVAVSTVTEDGRMIYYYSATGNTRFAAERLGRFLDEPVAKMTDNTVLSGGDTTGLMFPIYCWGIPPVARDFIETNRKLLSGARYLWAVCTCGDEAGLAMKSLDRLLGKTVARKADALFSVIMPNTYVLLPGFDVDPPETEKKKLGAAPKRLEDIAEVIKSRETDVYDVTEGSLPALRTAVYPIFERWGVNTRWWHVSEACISCGKCAAVCPARNIAMEKGHPSWGRRCYSCCACFHACPAKAISYSRFTAGKSQYSGPWKEFTEG